MNSPAPSTGSPTSSHSNDGSQRALLWLPGFSGQYAGAVMAFAMTCEDPVYLDHHRLAIEYNAKSKTIYRTIQRLIKNGYLRPSGRYCEYSVTTKSLAATAKYQTQCFKMRMGCTPLESVVLDLALRMKTRKGAATVLNMNRTAFYRTLNRASSSEAVARAQSGTGGDTPRNRRRHPGEQAATLTSVSDCDFDHGQVSTAHVHDKASRRTTDCGGEKAAGQTMQDLKLASQEQLRTLINHVSQQLKHRGNWCLNPHDRGRVSKSLEHCTIRMGYTYDQVLSGLDWFFERMTPKRWNPDYLICALEQEDPDRHPFGRPQGEKGRKLEVEFVKSTPSVKPANSHRLSAYSVDVTPASRTEWMAGIDKCKQILKAKKE